VIDDTIRGTPNTTPIPLTGEFSAVADMFTAEHMPRRLVVLGEPGAGKTMLVLKLALDLLDRRSETDPVPVLLSVANWNPSQPLDDWIADRLIADNPTLRRRVRSGSGQPRTVAQELVARQRILPILDGLDEMTAASHSVALAAIGPSLVHGRQMVLTCRTNEYEQAVGGFVQLARTPVVEILPLSVEATCGYLVDSTIVPERWDPVIATLLDTSTGPAPLADALSTPLAAWLAKVTYSNVDAKPTELLTSAWADTQESIERHLLGRFVVAVYCIRVGQCPGRSVEKASQAQRWLVNLATDLRNQSTYDIEWWHLTGRIKRLLVGFLGGFIGVFVFEIGLMLGTGLVTMIMGGLLGGLGFGLASTTEKRRPRHLDWRPTRRRFANGFARFVCPFGSRLGLLIDSRPGWRSTAFGLVGVTVRASEDRNIVIVSVIVIGFGLGLILGLTFVFTNGSVGWFLSGFEYGFVLGLVGGTGFGIAGCEWGLFSAGRVLLALRGQAPWRLMAFLDEAHRRGVLRQAGGVYQFRHALLRDHLADL
jgi:hypothetical protein